MVHVRTSNDFCDTRDGTILYSLISRFYSICFFHSNVHMELCYITYGDNTCGQYMWTIHVDITDMNHMYVSLCTHGLYLYATYSNA